MFKIFVSRPVSGIISSACYLAPLGPRFNKLACSSVMQGFGFPWTLIDLIGAWWSRISLKRRSNADVAIWLYPCVRSLTYCGVGVIVLSSFWDDFWRIRRLRRKRLLKTWLHTVSIFIGIIPRRSICQTLVNLSGVELLILNSTAEYLSLRKSLCCVNVLKKTWNLAVSRRRCATTARNCTKNHKSFVLLI